MPDLRSVFDKHTRYQDAMVQAFEDHLRTIVLRAQSHVLAELQRDLSITDGMIDATPANMKLLRKSGDMFMAEMRRAGYDRLVTVFVGEFSGTLPFLQDTIEYLGEQVHEKWRDLNFTQKDLKLLDGVKLNAAVALDSTVAAIAGAAVTRGLFGVSGLPFSSLVQTLTEQFETSIGKARTIADTSMNTWYRTASDRAFQIVEKDLPEEELKYRYSGPDDDLTRPFCEHLLAVDKAYTRDQVALMNNHQFPIGSVFVTAGGWNCRHQWILDVRDAAEALAQAA